MEHGTSETRPGLIGESDETALLGVKHSAVGLASNVGSALSAKTHRRLAQTPSQPQLRVSADSPVVGKQRRLTALSPRYRITSLRPGWIDPGRFVTIVGPDREVTGSPWHTETGDSVVLISIDQLGTTNPCKAFWLWRAHVQGNRSGQHPVGLAHLWSESRSSMPALVVSGARLSANGFGHHLFGESTIEVKQSTVEAPTSFPGLRTSVHQLCTGMVDPARRICIDTPVGDAEALAWQTADGRAVALVTPDWADAFHVRGAYKRWRADSKQGSIASTPIGFARLSSPNGSIDVLVVRPASPKPSKPNPADLT
jgi:hypothetical protein